MKAKTLCCGLMVLTISIIAGCGGLPERTAKRARELKNEIARTKEVVKEKRTRFDEIMNSDSFLVGYARDENWEETYFGAAQRAIKHASSVRTEHIEPILHRNEEEEADELKKQIQRVTSSLREATEHVRSFTDRVSLLKEVRENAPSMVETAQRQIEKIDSLLEPITTKTEKAKADYPEASIDERYQPLAKMQQDAHDALKTAEAELSTLENSSSSVDYAALADAVTLVEENLAKLKKQGEEYLASLDELYRSYTKILVDMRTDFYVQVGRSSWDQSGYSEQNYLYDPVRVSQEVYDQFRELPRNVTLAKLYYSWGSEKVDVRVDQNLWQALNVRPKESWPSGSHDTATYWRQNWSEKYYHKYEVVEDGERQTTDWQQVSLETFNAEYENLGMSIVTKPHGMFEDEAINEATPPGMAYVGNEKYGQWKERDDGTSFWEFYGQYAFFSMMLDGHGAGPYTYNQWDTWHNDYRGRRPYYGYGNSNTARYGTYSSRLSQGRTSRFGSSFKRRGGFKSVRSEISQARRSRAGRRQAAGVRGTGASRRGGGPGAGGK